MGIKIGNQDVEFKVGSGDCSIYLGSTLVYSGTPTPTFDGKWLATYTTGTSSAECDSSSAITNNEINKAYLVEVQIGDCVTTIGDSAFFECDTLSSVTIGSVVTTIGKGAFRSCPALQSITIPSGVTTIADGTFYGCTSLTSMTIPSGVTSIDNSAFHFCLNLSSVTINAITVPNLGSYAFRNTPIENGTGFIYVPSESVEAYKAATNWSAYADRIKAIP